MEQGMECNSGYCGKKWFLSFSFSYTFTEERRVDLGFVNGINEHFASQLASSGAHHHFYVATTHYFYFLQQSTNHKKWIKKEIKLFEKWKSN